MNNTLELITNHEKLTELVRLAKNKEAEYRIEYEKTRQDREKLEASLEESRQRLAAAIGGSGNPQPKLVQVTKERLHIPPFLQDLLDTFEPGIDHRRADLVDKIGCTDNALSARLQKTKAMMLIDKTDRGVYRLTDLGASYQSPKLRAVTSDG